MCYIEKCITLDIMGETRNICIFILPLQKTQIVWILKTAWLEWRRPCRFMFWKVQGQASPKKSLDTKCKARKTPVPNLGEYPKNPILTINQERNCKSNSLNPCVICTVVFKEPVWFNTGQIIVKTLLIKMHWASLANVLVRYQIGTDTWDKSIQITSISFYYPHFGHCHQMFPITTKIGHYDRTTPLTFSQQDSYVIPVTCLNVRYT